MKNVEVVASFPSSIVDRLRPFISTESTRYYLNGIHIVPQEDGARFEATNGHILGVQFAPDIAASEDIIVSLPKPSLISSAIGRLGGLFTIYKCEGAYALGVKRLAANADEVPSLFENDLIVSNCRIDGTFPDVVRVIPQNAVTPSTGVFNASYLRAIARGLNTTSPRLWAADEASPAVAYSPDGSFVAVIMPVRDTSTPRAALPDWLAHKKQAA